MSPRGLEQNEQMRTRTLETISRAALKVFAEYGYYGSTMKRITKVSGLSYGLVYHYFPSKVKLFYYLVDFALDNSLSSLTAVMEAPGTPWEKIENLSAMLIKGALTEESSHYFLIILQAMTQGRSIPGLSARIARGIEAYYDKFVPVIIRAQETGHAVKEDPVVLAAAYFSFVQGLAALAFQGKGMEKKITPAILSNVLRKGEQQK